MLRRTIPSSTVEPADRTGDLADRAEQCTAALVGPARQPTGECGLRRSPQPAWGGPPIARSQPRSTVA